jgi:hypothetical protein
VAEGHGRGIEIYSETNLFVGAAAPVDAARGRRAARVVELETPARPLGSGSGLPAEFTSASFDLPAILTDAARAELGSLLFWIRPLGRAREVARGWALSLEAASMPSPHQQVLEAPAWTLRLKAPQLPAGRSLRATCLLLTLSGLEGEARSASARLIDEDGKVWPLPADVAPGFRADQLLEVVALKNVRASLNGAEDPAEWWADVSMLTVPASRNAATARIPLLYDWLFTGSGDAPEDAASTERLRRMTEAQARIVSVSPPIPCSR